MYGSVLLSTEFGSIFPHLPTYWNVFVLSFLCFVIVVFCLYNFSRVLPSLWAILIINKSMFLLLSVSRRLLSLDWWFSLAFPYRSKMFIVEIDSYNNRGDYPFSCLPLATFNNFHEKVWLMLFYKPSAGTLRRLNKLLEF